MQLYAILQAVNPSTNPANWQKSVCYVDGHFDRWLVQPEMRVTQSQNSQSVSNLTHRFVTGNLFLENWFDLLIAFFYYGTWQYFDRLNLGCVFTCMIGTCERAGCFLRLEIASVNAGRPELFIPMHRSDLICHWSVARVCDREKTLTCTRFTVWGRHRPNAVLTSSVEIRIHSYRSADPGLTWP